MREILYVNDEQVVSHHSKAIVKSLRTEDDNFLNEISADKIDWEAPELYYDLLFDKIKLLNVSVRLGGIFSIRFQF